MIRPLALRTGVAALAVAAFPPGALEGSSHREAPLISEDPTADNTDVYAFRSYEPGRANYVTIIVNYFPSQDPFGAPSFFLPSEDAVYQIQIDSNGDANEDLTFTFDFDNINNALKVPTGDGKQIPAPGHFVGPVPSPGHPNLNVNRTYSVFLTRGGTTSALSNTSFGALFFCPPDNFGARTIPNYQAFIPPHIFTALFPGFANGRIFAGQRKDSFVANLGEVFDLFNTDLVGPRDGEANSFENKNVNSIAIEVPVELVTNNGTDPIIGVWATTSRRQVRTLSTNPTFDISATHSGPFVQVSRLGLPLINELIIGLQDKNRFNASHPLGDAQFIDYFTNPAAAVLMNNQFGWTIPTHGRTDLVESWLTGLPGLNQPAGVRPADMLRLNTTTAITPPDQQNALGVLGGDMAGFPNGRRPGDDVVDSTLRLIAGARMVPPVATSNLALTDGAATSAAAFQNVFPYLQNPIAGSPNSNVCLRIRSAATIRGPFEPVTNLTTDGTTVSVPRPDAPEQFYKIDSDVEVRITDVNVDPAGTPGGRVRFGVSPVTGE